MKSTTVRFPGTGSVVPAAGNDTASVLLNDRCLVDVGWHAPTRLQACGSSPLDLDYVLLTHCHHDHYLGLALLLFYLGIRKNQAPNRRPLRIIGPAADLRRVVNRARAFLQVERFPEIDHVPELILLTPGETYECEAFFLQTASTVHGVQSMCYRFHDRRTGVQVAVTGDTAYHPPLAEHVRGVDLLVHECSLATSDPDPVPSVGHSNARQAARIARAGEVKRLALIHCEEARQAESLRAAQEVFPETFFPRPGQQIEVHCSGTGCR